MWVQGSGHVLADWFDVLQKALFTLKSRASNAILPEVSSVVCHASKNLIKPNTFGPVRVAVDCYKLRIE